MKVRVWPFLVGKNKQLGYRPVVVPDILHAARIPGRVDEFRSNQLIETPLCKVIQTQELGPLTAIYRVAYLKDAGQMYVDLQNRPILWTEGVIFKGIYPDMELPVGAFKSIQQQLDQQANKFYLDGGNAKIINSRALEIDYSEEQISKIKESLKERVAYLREQEELLKAQLSDLDRKVQLGKTMAIVGIPLVLVVVGVIVIPIGLHLSNTANHEKMHPQEALQKLIYEISEFEKSIRNLETKQG